jgi:hypothetical protein
MPPKLAVAACLAALLSVSAVGALAAPRHGKPIRIDSGRAPSGGKWGFAAQQFGERGACARLRLPNRSIAQACRLPGSAVIKAAIGIDPCGDSFVAAVSTRAVRRVVVTFRDGRRRRATRYAPPEGIHYRGWFYLAMVKGVTNVRRIRALDANGRTLRLIEDLPRSRTTCAP